MHQLRWDLNITNCLYQYIFINHLSLLMLQNSTGQQTNPDKFEYNNAFSFDPDFENQDDSRPDQLKNEYSTFIQELEETTQKLMNQVFNSQYKPDINGLQVMTPRLFDSKTKNIINNKRYNKYGTAAKKNSNNLLGYNTFGHPVQGTQSFKNFMTRNNKWCEKKSNFIQKQIKKKQLLEQKQLTHTPQILRGSIEKLQPIYERSLQIHASKQKKRTYKKIEQKKQEDEYINRLPFHPEINQKSKMRSIQEYLKDKQEWEKKKNEMREQQKLKKQAEQMFECSFTPNLISKPIVGSPMRLKPKQKVEERLLRSLEKAFQQI